MKPTTAIILAAGTGTRFLPITSAIQKEMLPILNRPVVDYLVSDLVAAGVTRIIFVTRQDNDGLKDFYLGNAAYKASLERLGKTEVVTGLDVLHQQAQYEFIEQPEDGGYGTAAAAQTALQDLTPDGPVMILGGDNFVWTGTGKSDIQALIDTFMASGADGAINSVELPEADLVHLGVLSTRQEGEHEYLTGIIEKPSAGELPSHLANVSQYILNPEMLKAIHEVKPAPNGELYITNAVTAAAQNHSIIVHRATGQYLDTGTPEKWLEANNIVARSTKKPA